MFASDASNPFSVSFSLLACSFATCMNPIGSDKPYKCCHEFERTTYKIDKMIEMMMITEVTILRNITADGSRCLAHTIAKRHCTLTATGSCVLYGILTRTVLTPT